MWRQTNCFSFCPRPCEHVCVCVCVCVCVLPDTALARGLLCHSLSIVLECFVGHPALVSQLSVRPVSRAPLPPCWAEDRLRSGGLGGQSSLSVVLWWDQTAACGPSTHSCTAALNLPKNLDLFRLHISLFGVMKCFCARKWAKMSAGPTFLFSVVSRDAVLRLIRNCLADPASLFELF